MFDTSQPFQVRILSGGEKTESLRFPTDEELIERAKKLRHVRRNLGRNRGEWQTLNEEAVNAELFEKLRVEKNGDASGYDAAEAARFVDKLLDNSLVSSARVGDEFEVELAVTSQRHKVKHVLRMPTQRQMNDYSKQWYKSYDTKGGQDIRVLVEPAGKLWDSLQARVEGYTNGHVPINHKQAVLTEVIDLVRQLEEDDSDPEI